MTERQITFAHRAWMCNHAKQMQLWSMVNKQGLFMCAHVYLAPLATGTHLCKGNMLTVDQD